MRASSRWQRRRAFLTDSRDLGAPLDPLVAILCQLAWLEYNPDCPLSASPHARGPIRLGASPGAAHPCPPGEPPAGPVARARGSPTRRGRAGSYSGIKGFPSRPVDGNSAPNGAGNCRSARRGSGFSPRSGRTRHGRRILDPARLAFEIGTPFDRQDGVEDVAFDVTGGLQCYLLAANGSSDRALHHDIIGQQVAGNARFLSDDDAEGVDIAFDGAIDLHLALGLKISFDRKLAADDGGRDEGPTGRGGQPAPGGGRPRREDRPSSRARLLIAAFRKHLNPTPK